MKKTLLGLLFSAALIATSGLAANADDDQKSTGTVGFEGGSITIDNGGTELSGANLDFGTNKIEAADKDDNYDNTNKSAAVSVVDLRGTAEGWKLGVKQDKTFKNEAATANKELTGAVLTLNGVLDASASTTGADATVQTGVALVPGSGLVELMTADAGKGNGKNVADITKSQLMVPKTTARAKGSYSTTLTWGFTGAPANS